MDYRAVMRRTQNRLATGRQIRVEWRGDRAVLLQPGGGAVSLNDSAAKILELCDGTRTVDELVAEMLAQTGGAALESDVREFVEAALERGWIIHT